jgi:hypothetical protein
MADVVENPLLGRAPRPHLEEAERLVGEEP